MRIFFMHIMALVVLLSFMTGCTGNGSAKTSAASGPSLSGKWSLVRLDGRAPLAKTVISFSFITRKDGSPGFQGNGGCNLYWGKYSADPATGTFRVLPGMRRTMMKAADSVLRQERRYLRSLSKIGSYSVTGERLVLSGPGGIRLVYSRQRPAPDRALEKTVWRLTGIIEGQTAMPPVRGTAFSAVFTGGRFQGKTGCNTFTLEYSMDGDRLQVKTVSRTKMFCPDEYQKNQEDRIYRILSGMTRFRIRGNRLRLIAGNGDRLDFLAGDK